MQMLLRKAAGNNIQLHVMSTKLHLNYCLYSQTIMKKMCFKFGFRPKMGPQMDVKETLMSYLYAISV